MLANSKNSFIFLMKNKKVIYAAGINIIAYLFFTIFLFVWQPIAEICKINIDYYPIIYGVYLIASGIAAYIGGKRINKNSDTNITVIAFVYILTFSLFLCAVLNCNNIFLILGMIAFGMGKGVVFMLVVAYTNKNSPNELKASIFSLVNALATLVNLIMQVVFGQIIDLFGLSVVLEIGIALAIIWIILTLISRKDKNLYYSEKEMRIMKDKKYVLGINTSNHDRSAALLKDGKIVCAISEERIDRRKHSQGFYGDNSKSIVIPPLAAINYCLEAENISIDDLDLIVIGRSMQSCIDDVMKYIPIKDKGKIKELPIPSHHKAHAYSSYFASEFDNSLIIVIDEQGHWLEDNTFEKESIYIGKNSGIEELQSFKGNYTDISIGMFYDLFSVILGFTDGSVPAAGKLMGLSSYGHETDNIAAMLVSEAASLVLTGFCYYMVYRYFSRDDLDPVDAPETTMGMQQMVLIFIPILMIFIMSNYINAIEYDFQFEISVDKGPAEHFFSHGQMLSMYFLGLASLFCILFSYKKLQQIFRLSTEISLLEQQEHSLNQYVEEAKPVTMKQSPFAMTSGTT